MTDLRSVVEGRLLPWFAASRRDLPWRRMRSPYRVWVSELMLQQTRVDQVIPYFERFMVRFPTIEALASAPQEAVLKAWEGLGYYARARNLHRAARHVVDALGGVFPDTFAGLRALPGVGDYTAAAIASLAFGRDHAVVDGNVVRVLTRVHAYVRDVASADSKRALQALAEGLLVRGAAGAFNEAMMELGATVCTPRNPACAVCPLAGVCLAHRSGRPEDYPVKAPKKKVPHLVVGAAVVRNRRGEVLVAQRRDQDMLGGLWEFPGGKQEVGETIQQCIARELREELGIRVDVGEFLTTVRHAYSHFTMEMHVWYARIRAGRPRAIECKDYRWLPVDHLDSLPYSRADLHVIEALRASGTVEP